MELQHGERLMLCFLEYARDPTTSASPQLFPASIGSRSDSRALLQHYGQDCWNLAASRVNRGRALEKRYLSRDAQFPKS